MERKPITRKPDTQKPELNKIKQQLESSFRLLLPINPKDGDIQNISQREKKLILAFEQQEPLLPVILGEIQAIKSVEERPLCEISEQKLGQLTFTTKIVQEDALERYNTLPRVTTDEKIQAEKASIGKEIDVTNAIIVFIAEECVARGYPVPAEGVTASQQHEAAVPTQSVTIPETPIPSILSDQEAQTTASLTDRVYDLQTVYMTVPELDERRSNRTIQNSESSAQHSPQEKVRARYHKFNQPPDWVVDLAIQGPTEQKENSDNQ
jgi:hypothetical protein